MSSIRRSRSGVGVALPFTQPETACGVTPSRRASSEAVMPSSVRGSSNVESLVAALESMTDYIYSFGCKSSSATFGTGTLDRKMPRTVTEAQRREALVKAAKDWISKHGGQTAGARAAAEQGTPIKQQSLGWAAKGEKLGPKLADELAALYHTTPDGLVRYLLGEGAEEVPLRDIPGWRRAKQEAMEREGDLVDAQTWAAVDYITLPLAPREATSEMVIGFAQLLYRFTRASGVRKKLERSG